MVKTFNRHHRKPRSRGGNSKPRNISVVKVAEHEAFHFLFGNMTPQEIVKILNDTWVDPDYILVVHRKEKVK